MVLEGFATVLISSPGPLPRLQALNSIIGLAIISDLVVGYFMIGMLLVGNSHVNEEFR